MNREQALSEEGGKHRATARVEPFFASGEPTRRRLLAVLQLGVVSFVLWILSLYFAWDDRAGAAVDDPVNLWFNCIPLSALAMTLFCTWRPRHRTAGAIALIGLTIGLFYIAAENAFGMFTYNEAQPGAGFWMGLTSYIVLLVAAVYAGFLVRGEWCRGCRPDGRPRSPWLVLGLGVLGIGWIVARFLPDYVISVVRAPIGPDGDTLSEGLEPEILERGMVGFLEGAQFIPELAGWVILLLVAPLAAWMLRPQLAAALLGGFLAYAAGDIAASLAVDYALDYSDDLDNGLRVTVDYGLGNGFLALLATTTLFVIVIAAIYFTGPDEPVTPEPVAPGEV